MQTTAISNAVKTSSSAHSSSASKSSNDTSGLPFSDMLNREMDRSAVVDTKVNATPTATRNNSNTAQASNNNDSTPVQSAQDANPSPENTDTTTAASSTPQTRDASATTQGKGKTADDKQAEDDTAALSAASSELIALVTNMQQSAGVTADVKPDATAADGKPDGKDNTQSIDGIASAGSDTTADAAALAAAMTAQNTSTADTASSGGASNAAGNAADPLAATGEKSLPTSANMTTPLQRGITMTATPPSSDLKASLAAKSKHAGSLAAEADTSAAQDDKQAVVENTSGETPALQQNAQASHSESFTLPSHVQTQSQASHAQQQENPAIANLANAAAAMTNQSATALNQVQNPAAQFMDNLAPRVGTQEWNQALGQKVVWMANGEQQSASLTLNPPDLGPLQVVLSVTNNHATANFTAAQPEVRQALESAMPKLREMLGDAGIQLGQANVSAGMPNQQQNAFNAPSQQSSRHSSGGRANGDAADTQVRVGRVQPARSGVGLVDTFV